MSRALNENISMAQPLETALNMHDALLANAPEGVSHDADLCPFCDWAMGENGLPSGDGLEFADAQQPYGAVEYADPGYQPDKVKRYPIDTEAHALAAWSYIHQAGNAENYSADQLAAIRTKVAAALKRFGVDAENKEVERHKKLADAKAGTQKPKKASTDSSASAADGQPEAVASEGGNSQMETITPETHEALVEKALRDATASMEAEKAGLTAEIATLKETASAATAQVASLTAENERLNGELDTAQVTLKSTQDEMALLQADIAAKEEAAVKAELASERAGQVRNLGLFTEDYIADKSGRWADIDEAAWVERLDEWKTAKGQSSSIPAPANADVASAMTGSNEIKHDPAAVSPRRAALGLIS